MTIAAKKQKMRGILYIYILFMRENTIYITINMFLNFGCTNRI